MLIVQGTEAPLDPSSSTGPVVTSPYFLICPCCKWSSKEVGWEFEKPSGLSLQAQKLSTQTENIQNEFDALKDHLEGYITSTAPVPAKTPVRQPSRHISHLTQMAAKALHRDIPGLAAATAKRRIPGGSEPMTDRAGWDDLGEYTSKGTWEEANLHHTNELERLSKFSEAGPGGLANLERRWSHSWQIGTAAVEQLPERLELLTKLTKRCPEPNCRHLLIQPDTKSTRMKIKMVAMNYLPRVEVGRRRRRPVAGQGVARTVEEVERRRRERRRIKGFGREEEEEMGLPLTPGETYFFQVAFTNPLYDPIQIRLTQSQKVSELTHQVHILTPHFTVSALKDAWSYEDEEEEEDPTFGLETSTMDGGSEESRDPSLSKRSRLSVLGSGSLRDKRKVESGVEKRGNVSRVPIELEIMPGAKGPIVSDFEVRFTYRADEAEETKENKVKEEYKTFTYWTRVDFGMAEESERIYESQEDVMMEED
ncbi:hypothetical protein M231_01292 [Tremella mesenterica]|uniref:Dynactin subunit 4 n=1 Tax=Tremella mesenterica TaxID=5217 RepID=A0A4V1M4S5_TREME|nr:hypothetical protein M231_01292 [Tremella mesenterica]